MIFLYVPRKHYYGPTQYKLGVLLLGSYRHNWLERHICFSVCPFLSQSHSESSLDTLKDFTDGSIFKNHPFFSVNPKALRLHFYVDEFEVCNPLGAKRGKHKVLAVYYSVGNFAKKHWSKLKFVHLCLLIRYPFITQHDPDYSKFLQPVIDELEKLSTEGVTISDGETTYCYYSWIGNHFWW